MIHRGGVCSVCYLILSYLSKSRWQIIALRSRGAAAHATPSHRGSRGARGSRRALCRRGGLACCGVLAREQDDDLLLDPAVALRVLLLHTAPLPPLE